MTPSTEGSRAHAIASLHRSGFVGPWFFAAFMVLLCCMVVCAPARAQGFDGIMSAITAVPIPGASVKGDPVSTPSVDAGSVDKDETGSSDFTCPSGPATQFTQGIVNVLKEYQVSGSCNCYAYCGPVLTSLPGVVTKFWEGEMMLEVVRHKGCSPIAFGTKLPLGGIGKTLGTARSSGGEDGFYHVHAIKNLVLEEIKDEMEEVCHLPATRDVSPYLSEIDLSWNPAKSAADLASEFALTDVLALDLKQIAKKVLWAAANAAAGGAALAAAAGVQVAQSLACVGECLVITAGGQPMNVLGACSGCNGLVPPYTGQVTQVGERRAAELLAHRFVHLKMNHLRARRGWLSTTSRLAYCNGGFHRMSATFNKREFKLQSIFPQARSQMRKLGAPHLPVVGETGKQGNPVKQDYIFQLWKRRECCATPPVCAHVPF